MLPPHIWKLLNYMKDKSIAKADDIYHDAYNGDIDNENTLRAYRSKLNSQLLNISPEAHRLLHLSFKQGYVTRP